MKIGILGGTFDPIHLGHLIAAESAYDAEGLDRVLLIPSGVSYFKKDKNVTAARLRYQMTCAAAEGNDHFEVSDIEIRRPGDTYSAVTLEELHASHPDDVFYFIVGADTLVQMDTWKDPEKLFASAVILVQTRKDETDSGQLREEAERLRNQYGARIVFLPARNIEISSTDIRERVKEGRSIRYLVTPGVERFIREHGLYIHG